VVVATGTSMHFIDVSEPARPRRALTVLAGATRVAIFQGGAYAAVDKEVWSYDVATGNPLQTLGLAGSALTDLAVDGGYLYTMDASRTLRIVDLGDPLKMVVVGSLAMSVGGGQLTVAAGVAYIAAGNGTTGGLATVDVSNPAAPRLIKGVDSTTIVGDAIALNGSGLAVTVGKLGAAPGISALDLVNVSNPASTGLSLGRFALPAQPYGVATASGIAFVADGPAGLQVVQYLTADSRAVAPVVTLTGDYRSTGATTGAAMEGSLVRLLAKVTDDVQVREVAFHVDGIKVATVSAAPFEYRLTAPTIRSGRTSFRVRASATDTGGNIGNSAEILITLAPDSTVPQVVRALPANDAMPDEVTRIAVFFNKEIDPATLTADSFNLASAGADRTVGTADDRTVENGILSYRSGLRAAFLTFPRALSGNRYRISVASTVKDLAENPLASDFTADFEIEGAITLAMPPVVVAIASANAGANGGLVLAMPPVAITIAAPSAGAGANGLVLAMPPVVISIAATNSGAGASGLVLAMPPVAVSIAATNSGAGTSGLTLARPPVTVSIAPNTSGGSAAGLTLAQPPVGVKIAKP
jgi:hypothetical protein